MRQKEDTWHEDAVQVGDEVYILRWMRKKGYTGYYTYRVKMDNGQTLSMDICKYLPENYETSKIAIWSIILSVSTKRKRGYEFLKQTGKNGLTSLLIAKEILKYHISEVIGREKHYDHVIAVQWDDRARMRAYERGLRDLGFAIIEKASFGKMNYGKFLVKRIVKQC